MTIDLDWHDRMVHGVDHERKAEKEDRLGPAGDPVARRDPVSAEEATRAFWTLSNLMGHLAREGRVGSVEWHAIQAAQAVLWKHRESA